MNESSLQRLMAENRAKGVCPQCGGTGVVAALRAINRTGDPHLNRRCGACKGTGKYRLPVAPPETP